MMKVLFLLAFATVSMAYHDVVWPPHGMEECKIETGATDVEFKEFLINKPPVTDLAQCFYGCVYLKMKLLNEDMTFNPAVMEDYVQYLKDKPEQMYSPELMEKFIEMLPFCVIEANKNPPHHDVPEGHCVAAKHFGQCAIKYLHLKY